MWPFWWQRLHVTILHPFPPSHPLYLLVIGLPAARFRIGG
jgi:hypothetical protein